MSLHWCSHQILFPGVSWLELLQSSGSPADSLWLLSAVNNRAEKNYSWWLLCCDLSDLSQSILPLGTAAAAEYSWPWPASSLNILWTTAGCISGYEIPPQQCQSGMWGTLPFPPRFTVRGVWTFHINVFPLNQRENIFKMSLRHRLQFAEWHWTCELWFSLLQGEETGGAWIVCQGEDLVILGFLEQIHWALI